MTMRRWLLASAGLIVAPTAWAANTQWGQLAPYLDCPGGLRLNLAVSLAASAAALGGTWLSWRSAWGTEASFGARIFVARVACLTGPVFGYALLLQAMAGLVLTGCER